jgi:hypothetical protein
MNLLDNQMLVTDVAQLLEKFITLRNDVYKEGNETFHRWKHSIDRKCFVGSAENSRIMVTLPEKAANNYEFNRKLIFQGMNVARINCAHDNEEIWSSMVKNVRKAENELK